MHTEGDVVQPMMLLEKKVIIIVKQFEKEIIKSNNYMFTFLGAHGG